jgi:hypothetical protein
MLYHQLEVLQELLSGHDLHLSIDLGDDVLEFVVDDQNAVRVGVLSQHGVRDSSGRWECHRGDQVGNAVLDQVGHRAGQRQRTLITNNENIIGSSVFLDNGLDLPDDGGVGSAAQALVAGDGHEGGLLDRVSGLLLLEIGLIFEDALQATNTEALGLLQAVEVLLHLSCGDHLHSLI